MKKKRFDKVKAVKEKARDVIGTPRRTAVRSHRKAGESRTSLDPDLNRKNVAPDPHYVPREEYIEGAPRLSTVEGLHLKQPVVFKKPREGPRPKGEVLQYSPEVIEHLNILRASQGEQAVTEYLSNLKEQRNMTHTSIAEDLSRHREAPTPVDGSITAALKDAELKYAFFLAEIKRMTAEAERWRQIADSLKTAIKLTVGEVSMPKPQTGEKRERGYWVQKCRSVLNRTPNVPMSQIELQNILMDEEKCGRETVYASLWKTVKDGYLIKIDGKLALPEWTDPKRA